MRDYRTRYRFDNGTPTQAWKSWEAAAEMLERYGVDGTLSAMMVVLRDVMIDGEDEVTEQQAGTLDALEDAMKEVSAWLRTPKACTAGT